MSDNLVHCLRVKRKHLLKRQSLEVVFAGAWVISPKRLGKNVHQAVRVTAPDCLDDVFGQAIEELLALLPWGTAGPAVLSRPSRSGRVPTGGFGRAVRAGMWYAHKINTPVV